MVVPEPAAVVNGAGVPVVAPDPVVLTWVGPVDEPFPERRVVEGCPRVEFPPPLRSPLPRRSLVPGRSLAPGRSLVPGAVVAVVRAAPVVLVLWRGEVPGLGLLPRSGSRAPEVFVVLVDDGVKPLGGRPPVLALTLGLGIVCAESGTVVEVTLVCGPVVGEPGVVVAPE